MSTQTISGSEKVGLNVVDGRQQNNEARWPDPSMKLARHIATEAATLALLALYLVAFATLAYWVTTPITGAP